MPGSDSPDTPVSDSPDTPVSDTPFSSPSPPIQGERLSRRPYSREVRAARIQAMQAPRSAHAESKRRWAAEHYAADPVGYNRARLVRALNSRRVLAPRAESVAKYSLTWDPHRDMWF